MQFPRFGETFANDMKTLDTKRDPIISELLYEGDVWMMSANPASGKSTIVSNMLLSLSNGHPLFNCLETKKKRVYILQTEGDYEESIERLRYMTKKIPYDANNICWDLFRYLDLNEKDSIDFLVKRIKDVFDPEVIIIDPIYKLTSVDISKAEGASQIVKLSDTLKDMFGATIVLIHHNTKVDYLILNNKKFDKDDSYYGHSFIKNHIRTAYALSLDEKKQNPILERKKGRGSDTLDSIKLNYDSETMTCHMELKGGSVIDRIKVFAGSKKSSKNMTSFDEVQKSCGLSVSYLRKLKTEGSLEGIFEFIDGKQGRQDWIAK